jgi:predicted MFS family arabinose efflux permease
MSAAVEWIRTPVGRGFVLLFITTLTAGFAMAAQGNIVSNFFQNDLGLTGPQFGYITAIREIPGFLLIFITALFYRMSLQRLTALALVLLSIGYAFFGTATSFWSVAPWVIISSIGYHTWLQTQHALGMSLVTERRTGGILGRLSATASAGAVLAMVTVMAGFATGILNFNNTYVLCAALALIAAIAIFFFPTLQEGQSASRTPKREPIVLRKEYRNYYLLNLLDGGRQQIFFSFGPWVLVSIYGLDVQQISAILLATTLLSMTFGSYLGRLIDRYTERPILAVANVGYVVALGGYALGGNVWIAIACYVIYSFIFPLSHIGASTYLRKVAARDEIAPSLAMGITMQHAAAIVVPLVTGFVLNFVGYQIPFLVACGFAILTFFATRRLSPETQRSPKRIAEDLARADGRQAEPVVQPIASPPTRAASLTPDVAAKAD